MFQTYEQAAEFIKDQQIEMIDYKFADLWGRWHHVTITTREFTPQSLISGVGFDGSSVGLKSVKSGDMTLIPDLSTAFVDPFWEVPTLSFICSAAEADTKKMFTRDPRVILQRAEEYLRTGGIADKSVWGPELEFYIFDKVSVENNIHTASYRVESSEANWNSCQPGLGHYIPVHGGYHAIPPRDQLFGLRTKMVNLLEQCGVPVKYHHHEVGGPGQCEIETPMMGMLKSADAAMLIKYISKMVGFNAGKTVTYLPKPLFGEAGSGMHFHQQLFKKDVNVFYDAGAVNLLSQTALYYIGGLLTHAPAVLALTNPTTNSYRRLVPGFEAPVNAFFSSGNRSAAIRVPKYATEPDKVRFEFRPPDAMCNPYTAMAAMLMAGIDGIKKQIDPTAAGFGPIDVDIFTLPEEKRATIKKLPTSLGEALVALEADHDFLLAGDVFDEDMIQNWIKTKHREEYEIQIRPHPYEIEQYYDL
jgi:glutamine synthetase